MSKKHERNFLIKTLPDNFNDWEKCRLKEWFLSNDDDFVSLRVRLYDDNRCYMDIKKDTDKESWEHGIKCKYDDIKLFLIGISVTEKDRYKYRTDNYLLVIDIFDDGKMIFEIESKDKNIIDNFVPFKWLGEELFDL